MIITITIIDIFINVSIVVVMVVIIAVVTSPLHSHAYLTGVDASDTHVAGAHHGGGPEGVSVGIGTVLVAHHRLASQQQNVRRRTTSIDTM